MSVSSSTQKKPDFYGAIGFCVGIRSASKERIYTGREVKKKIVSGRRRCGLYYILFLIGKRGRTLFVSNSWPSCSSSIWIGYPMLCLYLPPTPPSLYTVGLNNNARRLGPLPLLAFFFLFVHSASIGLSSQCGWSGGSIFFSPFPPPP